MYGLCEQVNGESLPKALRERYRVADGPALKVALFLLCANASVSQAEISSALSMPAEVVSRSLAFWIKEGLVKELSSKESSLEKKPLAASQKPLSYVDRPPLSLDEISEISLRNPDVSVLVRESQSLMGRTLDSNESRLLLEIFEYDRLPVDVILTLVAFCAPRAKSTRKIIANASRLAEELNELGINTIELVNSHIRLLELREKRENEVAAALLLTDKSFSRSAKTHIARWYEEYGYDVAFVKEAYLRTGNNSVPYISAILKSWYNNGYRTLKDTQAEISNADAPVSKTRERGENSLIKRALTKRKETDTEG